MSTLAITLAEGNESKQYDVTGEVSMVVVTLLVVAVVAVVPTI